MVVILFSHSSTANAKYPLIMMLLYLFSSDFSPLYKYLISIFQLTSSHDFEDSQADLQIDSTWSSCKSISKLESTTFLEHYLLKISIDPELT